MTTVNDVINLLISQIGTCENPMGSNNVLYNTWYYRRPVSGKNYPWCSVFVSWIFYKLNAKSLIHVYSAYSGNILDAMRRAGEEIPISQARAGDIVTFDYGDGGRTDHIAIIEKRVGPISFGTIEGNTGDCVKRRTRTHAVNCNMFFTRPKYKVPEPPKERMKDAMYVTPQVLPKQGDLYVWVMPEGINQLAIWPTGAHCWLNIHNENTTPVEVLVYTSPASGEHKLNMAGWKRKSFDIGSVVRNAGVKGGFSTVVKCASPNIAPGISVFED